MVVVNSMGLCSYEVIFGCKLPPTSIFVPSSDSVWSKTTLSTGGMGGAGLIPQT